MEDLKNKLNILESQKSDLEKELSDDKEGAIATIKEALGAGMSEEELLAKGFAKSEIDEAQGISSEKKYSDEEKRVFLSMVKEIKDNKLKIDSIKKELEKLREEKRDIQSKELETKIPPRETEPEKKPVKRKEEKEIEEFNSQKLKIEIEKVVKSFAETLKKKSIAYEKIDVENMGDEIRIIARLAGTGLKGFVIGKINFIAKIKSMDGSIVVTDKDLDANDIVKKNIKKEDIDKFANNIGDNLKDYIEKDRGKKVDRIDIVNGVLKITYK